MSLDQALEEYQQMLNSAKSLSISESASLITEGTRFIPNALSLESLCSALLESTNEGASSTTPPTTDSTEHVGPMDSAATPEVTRISPTPSPPTSPQSLTPATLAEANSKKTLSPLLPSPDLPNSDGHYSPILEWEETSAPAAYRAPAIKTTRARRQYVSTPYPRSRIARHHAESSRRSHAESSRRDSDSESSGPETSAPATPEPVYASEVLLTPVGFVASDPIMGNRHMGSDEVVSSSWLEQSDSDPELDGLEGKDTVEGPDRLFTLADVGVSDAQGMEVEVGINIQFMEQAPETGAGVAWDGDVNMEEDVYAIVEGYASLPSPEPASEPIRSTYPSTISVSIDVQVPTPYSSHTAAIRYICNAPEGVDERAVFLPGHWETLSKAGCSQALELFKVWCVDNGLLQEGWDMGLVEVHTGRAIDETMIGMLGTFGAYVESIVSDFGPHIQFRMKQAPSALYAQSSHQSQGEHVPRPSLNDGAPPVNIYPGDEDSLPEVIFSIGTADPPSPFRKRRSARVAKTKALAEAARREALASKTRSGRRYNLVDEVIERRRKLAPGIGVHYADEDEEPSIVGLTKSFKRARI
ncbi:hypothetical protein IAT38_006162 [Cryptococcus sp. DSM 104549]